MSDSVSQLITRVSAYGLIVNDGRIVLCRISDDLPSHAGQWTLPGGGLTFGEDPVEGMMREVREETGLVVRAASVAGVDSIRANHEDRSYHGIRIIYHVERIGGTLTDEVGGSTDRCAYWSRDEADDLELVDLGRRGMDLAFTNA